MKWIQMSFVWFHVLLMDNTTKVTLDMHKSPIIYIINTFFQYKIFQLLQIWKESNHDASCPSKFIILKHTIYVNNILQQSWMKRLLTIIILLTNYWIQNWNMQPITYTYNMKNFMTSFKFICQNLKLTLTWKLNKYTLQMNLHRVAKFYHNDWN